MDDNIRQFSAPGSNDADSGPEDTGGKRTQSQILLELAEPAELFKSPGGELFATIPVDDHFETARIRSSLFRGWLKRRFYEIEKRPPSAQAFQDALGVIESRAEFEGPTHPVYTRVAGQAGRVYIDLGGACWNVVEISAEGWNILETSPVRFTRARGMLPLPHPEAGGDTQALRPYVNCATEDDFCLVIAWLIGSLKPSGPYSLIGFEGEQGSAKTTTARLLKELVDPNEAPVRSLPRNEHELVISARNAWALSFDNLSGLKDWFSDALCRLSTGGGFATRELYSDFDEAIFDATRPIILNGIADLTGRQDLVDRSIIITLPSIPPNRRQLERDFWAQFKSDAPKILGALYTGVSAALRDMDIIKLSERPRMADFAQWVTAAESGLMWKRGTFMEAYAGNRSRAIEAGLEADVVAVAMRTLMADINRWEGTPTKLIEDLEQRASESTIKSRNWPKPDNQTDSSTALKRSSRNRHRGRS